MSDVEKVATTKSVLEVNRSCEQLFVDLAEENPDSACLASAKMIVRQAIKAASPDTAAASIANMRSQIVAKTVTSTYFVKH